MPYSPQGKGRLARPWGEQSLRSTVDKVVQSFDSPLDEPVVNAVQQVAEARGVTMAQVALAWVLKQPGRLRSDRRRDQATSPPRSGRGAGLALTDDEVSALQEPYTRQGPSWF